MSGGLTQTRPNSAGVRVRWAGFGGTERNARNRRKGCLPNFPRRLKLCPPTGERTGTDAHVCAGSDKGELSLGADTEVVSSKGATALEPRALLCPGQRHVREGWCWSGCGCGGGAGQPGPRPISALPSLLSRWPGTGSPQFPGKARIWAIFGKLGDQKVNQEHEQQPLTGCGLKLHGPKPKMQGAPQVSAAGGGLNQLCCPHPGI